MREDTDAMRIEDVGSAADLDAYLDFVLPNSADEAYRPPPWMRRDSTRQWLEDELLSRLYDLFLIQRPESWGPADAAWMSPLQVAISTLIIGTERNPLCITDIARKLDCSRQTISRSVANMERKTYVTLERDPRDRRRVNVLPQCIAELPAEWARKWDKRLLMGVIRTPLPELRAARAGVGSLLAQLRMIDSQGIGRRSCASTGGAARW